MRLDLHTDITQISDLEQVDYDQIVVRDLVSSSTWNLMISEAVSDINYGSIASYLKRLHDMAVVNRRKLPFFVMSNEFRANKAIGKLRELDYNVGTFMEHAWYVRQVYNLTNADLGLTNQDLLNARSYYDEVVSNGLALFPLDVFRDLYHVMLMYPNDLPKLQVSDVEWQIIVNKVETDSLFPGLGFLKTLDWIKIALPDLFTQLNISKLVGSWAIETLQDPSSNRFYVNAQTLIEIASLLVKLFGENIIVQDGSIRVPHDSFSNPPLTSVLQYS